MLSCCLLGVTLKNCFPVFSASLFSEELSERGTLRSGAFIVTIIGDLVGPPNKGLLDKTIRDSNTLSLESLVSERVDEP
ncbi:hypothetical protein V6N12_013417 [Hibiscus sabdariffa]|uniref:Uncharacterized protein n=1 Tax=Hibiscus sabdariffa TaxID=183260 RepID=A0ABR2D850_9ROSI